MSAVKSNWKGEGKASLLSLMPKNPLALCKMLTEELRFGV